MEIADQTTMNDVRTLKSVVDEGLDGFAGVFVPGGHAPIVDLMVDRDAGTILRLMWVISRHCRRDRAIKLPRRGEAFGAWARGAEPGGGSGFVMASIVAPFDSEI